MKRLLSILLAPLALAIFAPPTWGADYNVLIDGKPATITGDHNYNGGTLGLPTNAGEPSGTQDEGDVVYDTTGDALYISKGGGSWEKLDYRLVAEVRALATSTVPTGWLECDGASISRTTYADLFAAIGITHGQGDGSTTFNLPDYRGRFLRGWDHGAGRDPDAASRTASATGGATGDNVGSVQADAFKSHTHTQAAAQGVIYWTDNTGANGALATGNTQSVSSTGGNETRPLNANVMYIIKY